jgi:hypothetical protein
VHDQYPVRDADELRQFGGNDDDRFPRQCQCMDQFINLFFRTDVDTSCRLIEDVQLDGLHEPLAEDDLLLVAAGKIVYQRIH